ncbi:MAG: SDR family oxidoreductase, partial [Lentisphaeria bacterium]|nr:SDR family oxidoreductase [Lentisphaeria bacterium]
IARRTQALAMSLAGVARVNAIAPGWIDTREYHLRPGPSAAAPPPTAADRRQHSVGRIGRPEDIAGLAAYLCQEESSFINGECITVDGGMSRQMIYHGDEGWSFSPPAKP